MHIQGIQLWQQLLQQSAMVSAKEDWLAHLASQSLQLSQLRFIDDNLALNFTTGSGPMRLSLELSSLTLLNADAKSSAQVSQFARILSQMTSISFSAHSGQPQITLSGPDKLFSVQLTAEKLRMESSGQLAMSPITRILVGNSLLPISVSETTTQNAPTPSNIGQLVANELIGLELRALREKPDAAPAGIPFTEAQNARLKAAMQNLTTGLPTRLMMSVDQSMNDLSRLNATLQKLSTLDLHYQGLKAPKGERAQAPSGLKLKLSLEQVLNLGERTEALKQQLSRLSRQIQPLPLANHSVKQGPLSPTSAFGRGSPDNVTVPGTNPDTGSTAPVTTTSDIKIQNQLSKTLPDVLQNLIGEQQYLLTLLKQRLPGGASNNMRPGILPSDLTGPDLGNPGARSESPSLSILYQIQNQIFQLAEWLLSNIPPTQLAQMGLSSGTSLTEILSKVIALIEAHTLTNTSNPNANLKNVVEKRTSHTAPPKELTPRLPEIFVYLSKLLRQQFEMTSELIRHMESQQLQMLRQTDQLAPQLINLPLLQNGEIREFEILFESPSKRMTKKSKKLYRVTISFDLPPLGPMYAKLEMRGTHISTRIMAQKESTVALLNEFMPVLEKSLADAGLQARVHKPSQERPPTTLAEIIQNSINLRV